MFSWICGYWIIFEILLDIHKFYHFFFVKCATGLDTQTIVLIMCGGGEYIYVCRQQGEFYERIRRNYYYNILTL